MTPSTDEPGLPTSAETTGRTVVALFEARSEAEDAIRALKDAGFTKEQIGVATQDAEDPSSGLAEGATAGALSGGIIGGLVGLISSLLVPGLGLLVVGGVLASTLMGMGVGAATGGLIGALAAMGVPEEDARYFDAGLREGRTLLTVSDTGGIPEALAILQRHGADLGPSRSRLSERPHPYRGQERRFRSDAAYPGPERRVVSV